MLARAMSSLLLIAFAAVVMLFSLAAEYPTVTLFAVPAFVAGAWELMLRRREKREKAHDARMRDEHVPSMSPLEYEHFVARQLERAGWHATHCGRSGDQGCDVLAVLRGHRAVVQVKLYRGGKVGNSAIQEVVAARRHRDAHVMVVVAPGGFTRSAQELADANGAHLLHHSALHTLAQVARIP